MRVGRHMSRTAEMMRRSREMGCDTVQYFVTNPKGWAPPSAKPKEEADFRALLDDLNLRPAVVHAAYIINLASPNDDIFGKSVTLLRATLERAAGYGASSVVFHVGSHVGSGEEAGLARLTEGLRRVLADQPEGLPTLLLENDTGGGGKLGLTFSNIARVLDALPEHAAHLGVCLDTAHLWGAGYDIGTPEDADRVLTDADGTLGLGRVAVIHGNDSQAALGSHRDLHARFGEGQIPPEGMAAFLRDPRLAHVLVILETPYPETSPDHIDWDAETAHMQRALAVAGKSAPSAVTATMSEG